MYKPFIFATGTLCVIAAMSLLRLHLIESQYAAVGLVTTDTSENVPLPTNKNIGTVEDGAALFPITPSKEAPQEEDVAPAEAITQEKTTNTEEQTILVPNLTDVSGLNTLARSATVNIACTAPGSGSIASGSGIVIDPRGVIITNAHVAQYLLLQETGRISIDCTIRTGATASDSYKAKLLYISPTWVRAHANEVREERSVGTGENDYALLQITESTTLTPLPKTFSYITPDTRGLAQVTGQKVLVTSYPAGFLGNVSAQYALSLVTTVGSIQELFTFTDESSIDLISLGGIISAQSGSSGGGVIDGIGHLLGIIATAKLDGNTSQRDLHAITLFHINSGFISETGKSINEYLSGDLNQIRANFHNSTIPELDKLYLDALLNN